MSDCEHCSAHDPNSFKSTCRAPSHFSTPRASLIDRNVPRNRRRSNPVQIPAMRSWCVSRNAPSPVLRVICGGTHIIVESGMERFSEQGRPGHPSFRATKPQPIPGVRIACQAPFWLRLRRAGFLRGLRDSVLRSVASVRSVSSLAQTPKLSRLSEGPHKNVAFDRRKSIRIVWNCTNRPKFERLGIDRN